MRLCGKGLGEPTSCVPSRALLILALGSRPTWWMAVPIVWVWAALHGSFVLGIGLYGSVYLLPVFLSLVRYLSPVEIGLVVLVTGLAQLISAPVSVLLDRVLPARMLSMIGFAMFAAGLSLTDSIMRHASSREISLRPALTWDSMAGE